MNEQRECLMKERDIISAGLKIVGCFLVIQGVLSILSYIIPVAIDLCRLPEMVSALDGAAEMTQEEQSSIADKTRTVASIAIVAHLTRDAFKLLLGIYFCRGGRFVARLLAKKEDS
jgi:hypothetical protein